MSVPASSSQPQSENRHLGDLHSKINLADLDEAGFLFSRETIELLRKYHANNPKTIKLSRHLLEKINQDIIKLEREDKNDKELGELKKQKEALDTIYKEETPRSVLFVKNKMFALYRDFRRIVDKEKAYLGRGQYGHAKLAQDLETGEWVAVKIITHKAGQDIPPEIKREKEMLDKLGLLHGYKEIREKNKVYIVQTLFKGERFWDLPENPEFVDHTKRNSKDALKTLMSIAIDTLGTLQEIHDNQIIQADFHGGNILVDLTSRRSSIIDFGQSKTASEENRDELEQENLKCLKELFYTGYLESPLRGNIRYPEVRQETLENDSILTIILLIEIKLGKAKKQRIEELDSYAHLLSYAYIQAFGENPEMMDEINAEYVESEVREHFNEINKIKQFIRAQQNLTEKEFVLAAEKHYLTLKGKKHELALKSLQEINSEVDLEVVQNWMGIVTDALKTKDPHDFIRTKMDEYSKNLEKRKNLTFRFPEGVDRLDPETDLANILINYKLRERLDKTLKGKLGDAMQKSLLRGVKQQPKIKSLLKRFEGKKLGGRKLQTSEKEQKPKVSELLRLFQGKAITGRTSPPLSPPASPSKKNGPEPTKSDKRKS